MVSQFITKSNIIFACKFIGIGLILSIALDYTPVLSQRNGWTQFLATVSCSLVQSFTPNEECTRQGATILSKKTPIVVVTKECDGLNALILLTAAVISFPCRPREKIVGLAIGCPLLVLCNILRITGLYYVSKYFHGHFDLIHTAVAPMATIMPTVIFYFIWLSRTKHNVLAN